MKTSLIISTVPPQQCGIATYAGEQARALEDQGIVTVRIPPLGGDFGSRAGFFSAIGIIRFICRLAGTKFDSLSLHYADRFFFPWLDNTSGTRMGNTVLRILQTAGLALIGLMAGKRGELVIHEISTDARMPETVRIARGLALSCFDKMLFHSTVHRDSVIGFFPFLRKEKAVIVSHHRFMSRIYPGTQEEARRELSTPRECRHLFLCIGFWNPSKGFEDAIDSFPTANPQRSMLFVVGTPGNTPDAQDYADLLASRVKGRDAVSLVRNNLTDKEFDCWIQASDTVILPYHSISSSGVAARAALYGKKIVMRNLPAFQAEHPTGVFFETRKELALIIESLCSG